MKGCGDGGGGLCCAADGEELQGGKAWRRSEEASVLTLSRCQMVGWRWCKGLWVGVMSEEKRDISDERTRGDYHRRIKRESSKQCSKKHMHVVFVHCVTPVV